MISVESPADVTFQLSSRTKYKSPNGPSFSTAETVNATILQRRDTFRFCFQHLSFFMEVFFNKIKWLFRVIINYYAPCRRCSRTLVWGNATHFYLTIQVCVYIHLHIGSHHKNSVKGLLCRTVYLPQRPLELAGLYGHQYGVSEASLSDVKF